jgi:hypothetical protein
VPATSPSSPTDPDATAAGGAEPDRPGTTRLADDLLLVDDATPRDPTRPGRRAATIAVAALLAAVAIALVVLMQTGPDRPGTLVTAQPGAATNEDGTPVATIGAPRPSTTEAPATPDTTAAPDDATGAEGAPDTTTPTGATAPATSAGPTAAAPTSSAPGAPTGPATGPAPNPVVVTTAPPAPVTTLPPVTAPPTTPYVQQFGTIHLDVAPDGVGVTGRDQDVRIPAGGRAFWTNHTTRTDLEVIVNGSSYPIPKQHSSLRIDFTQPGTFTWSLVGHPGVQGTITVF